MGKIVATIVANFLLALVVLVILAGYLGTPSIPDAISLTCSVWALLNAIILPIGA